MVKYLSLQPSVIQCVLTVISMSTSHYAANRLF